MNGRDHEAVCRHSVPSDKTRSRSKHFQSLLHYSHYKPPAASQLDALLR